MIALSLFGHEKPKPIAMEELPPDLEAVPQEVRAYISRLQHRLHFPPPPSPQLTLERWIMIAGFLGAIFTAGLSFGVTQERIAAEREARLAADAVITSQFNAHLARSAGLEHEFIRREEAIARFESINQQLSTVLALLRQRTTAR